MRSALRSLLAEPRAAGAPGPQPRDWWLAAATLLVAAIETPLRTDLAWWPADVALVVVIALVLPWRRTHPLAAVALAFGASAAHEVLTWLIDEPGDGLYVGAVALLLPYALFRWGSGREAAAAIPFFAGVNLLLAGTGSSTAGEAVGGMVALLFLAAIGAAVRFRLSTRSRERQQVKLEEREKLARELHDTVAHHVSAIAIQAQAGRTVGAGDPEAALAALDVIEREASRTLVEMRAMVGVLRDGRPADLAPQRGVADIPALAGGDPRIEVRLTGDLGELPPTLDAALYRMAQESITNARRHARHASRVDVAVEGAGDHVRLSVRDDGDPVAFAGEDAYGFGLLGMAERAKLLGGSFRAGPAGGRGWSIDAVLPRAAT